MSNKILEEARLDAERKLIALTPRLKQAHMVNLAMCVNGRDEVVECDWLKYLYYETEKKDDS